MTNSERGESAQLADWVVSLFPDKPEVLDSFLTATEESPARIPNAYRELLSGYDSSIEEFLKVTEYLQGDPWNGVVNVDEIHFTSMCAHHFLPFFGTVNVSYVPGSLILGLGKIPRIVDMRARRFQIQERLARELAEDFMGPIGAAGVQVRVVAQHLCMCARGPRSFSSRTTTTYRLGAIDPERGDS